MTLRTILTIVLLSLYLPSVAQSSKIELFEAETPLECTLAFDLRKLNREKLQELDQDALITCYQQDSIFLEKAIRISARGISRKQICYLPPIRLNLEDSVKKSGGFKKHKSIKLVTHCELSKTYQEYVLKEYLIYKLYNLVTDESFQVRLMNVRYIDTGRKTPKEYPGYGFVIEDIDVVAERNDAFEIEVMTVNQAHLDPDAMRRVAIFQFMIGNTDWSVPGLHNLKLLRSNDFQKIAPIPVPYDFDMSGFVNASYALPDPLFPISHVRERYFRGICGTLEDFKEALQPFYEIKDAVYQTILEFEYIEEKTRTNLIRYINEFYEIIESDKNIQSRMLNSCKEVKVKTG
jgi:hypothetical protein